MIDWIIVLALIVTGLILIVVEVIFVPGTTIVGILGLVAVGIGVFMGFDYFGKTVGWWLLGGSSVAFVISLYYSFKSNAWDRFSLKSSMEGKVNEGYTSDLNVTDQGIALSTLRPMGKAEFNNKAYEVRSYGDYIDSATEIEIVKIEGSKIYVKPITK